MSASAGLMMDLGMVMFLAIGGDTEDEMKHDAWRQAGLCDKYCHWEEYSPECKRQQARNLPCDVDCPRAHFWDDYLNEPERGWDPRNLPLAEKPLFAPEWVPADQPTPHGRDGLWLKLRLEVAESELSAPSRVRARRAPAATAWGRLSGILAAIEAHVRTFAAVPAHIIQRVREGR